jgi:hypothetical protein
MQARSSIIYHPVVIQSKYVRCAVPLTLDLLLCS